MKNLTRFCIQNYDFGEYFIVSEYNEFINNIAVGDTINFDGYIKKLGPDDGIMHSISIHGEICAIEKTVNNDPKTKTITLSQRISVNISKDSIQYIEISIKKLFEE